MKIYIKSLIFDSLYFIYNFNDNNQIKIQINNRISRFFV
jgi:hypothetical protein